MEHWYIYLFGVLRRFQHCTGHITMGSWKGRGNQYIQFVRVLYCKLPTNGKQLPAFPLEAVPGIEPRPQRWEARVLPLCHRGPLEHRYKKMSMFSLVPPVPVGTLGNNSSGDLTLSVAFRGVAVAIFSFRFPVFHFPVGYRLTVSYLTKHENQIVSIL